MFLFLCCNVNIAHKPNSYTVVNKGQKVLQSFPQLLKSCYCNLVLATQSRSVVVKLRGAILVYSWKLMEKRTSPEHLAECSKFEDYLNCNINTQGLASSVPSGCVAFL